MVDTVVSVGVKVSEYLFDPIVRQFGYLSNYPTNIKDLSQKVVKVKDARAGKQHSVDEAIQNGHKIEQDVCNWLTLADGFIQDACHFLESEKEVRKSCNNGVCPKLKSRYNNSREAKKKVRIAVQIHGNGQFQTVSYRAPLLKMIRSVPSPSEALPSRISTLNKVMEALNAGE